MGQFIIYCRIGYCLGVLNGYTGLDMPMTEEEALKRRTERFMAMVYMEPTSGCWLWGGRVPKHRNGYGVFKVRTNYKCKVWKAHRWAAKYIGGMDIEGKHVCHHCDVRSCVNPDHLWLGDHAANMADMARKGRARNQSTVGSSHGRAKLCEADIPVIRYLLAKGNGPKRIAPLFGVAPETIGDIKHGRHWTHVL